MSVKTRTRNKKEKRVRRHQHEVVRLERVIGQYHERLPKLEKRLDEQKSLLSEAEAS